MKDIPEEVIDSITLVDEATKIFTLESYLKIIPTCVDLKGRILINKTRIPFITSDNPVCLHNQFMEKVKYPLNALGVRGTIIYFPLSLELAPYITMIKYTR